MHVRFQFLSHILMTFLISLNSNMFAKGKVHTSGNYDDFTEHGHYVCSNTVNNAPVSEGWFSLTVFESTVDNDIVQIAHALSSNTQAWRTYSNKEWSRWRVENLSSLTTSKKSSLVDAVNEVNVKVGNTYNVIKQTLDKKSFEINIPSGCEGVIQLIGDCNGATMVSYLCIHANTYREKKDLGNFTVASLVQSGTKLTINLGEYGDWANIMVTAPFEIS